MTALITDDPEPWVALTGPCPTCHGRGLVPVTGKTLPYDDCPDCRDGRRLTDFGGVRAIVVAVEPEPDGRNWRITLELVS